MKHIIINCDMQNLCNSTMPEVRKLPLGDGKFIRVCKNCFNFEAHDIREQNRTRPRSEQVTIPEWKNLEVYQPE